jgi:thiamine-monophosphate kinase
VGTSEFALIQQFFTQLTVGRDDVVLGIGDDCALLQPPPEYWLAVTIDTLVADVHFFADADPQTIGHKSLAVNLSDLAALGARPAWVTLALTLPEPEHAWLAAFSRGFARLAEQHNVQLIGGDTTQGPLTITVQAHGFVPVGQGMRRAGAQVGDLIYVTGTLGDAGLALQQRLQGMAWSSISEQLRSRLERPEPRVQAGLALREIATSAIDISDGLWGDLDHILHASRCGAHIYLERLPLSPDFIAARGSEVDWQLPLTAGDDYELCFTVSPVNQSEIEAISARLQLRITQIGVIEAMPGLRCLREDASQWSPGHAGYEHFRNAD